MIFINIIKISKFILFIKALIKTTNYQIFGKTIEHINEQLLL